MIRRVRLPKETEFISSADSTGCVSVDDWCVVPAVYGDPEEALIARDEPAWAPAPKAVQQLADIRQLMTIVLPEDRLVTILSHQGMSQEDIGLILGITQVSVHARIHRLRAWMRLVCSVRPYLRRVVEPHWRPDKESDQRQKGVWEAVMWRHEVMSTYADETGQPQSSVSTAWKGACTKILAGISDPEIYARIKGVIKRITKWQKPSHRRGLRQTYGPEGTSDIMDQDLRGLIWDLDLDLVMYRLDHPEPRRVDHRNQSHGVGIDLSRRAVVREVRALYGKYGARRVIAGGMAPEDGLADVLMAIEVRNQGQCPWDCAKGAFSSYVVRIIHQQISRSLLKHHRQTQYGHRCGDAILATIVVDTHSPEEYEAAEESVIAIVGQHAGPAGEKYARAKLGHLGSVRLCEMLSSYERNQVNQKRDKIIADLI